MNPQNQKVQSPKAKQFTEELNDLLVRYQYQLVAKLQVNETGIKPVVTIVDVIPPKKENLPIVKTENKKLVKKAALKKS